ncbi:Tyrosine-protein kinase YwqD [Bacillus sp. THAF10]|uniref:CpsD/CapB family tyrosine-protein kinase n=1 Tax=Bacillus sp. THAF10 TaxID=2587848 RepID=UPI0012690FCF|nr:CpsD/CapB family tyrosine-protein kinase [Bacillus sp. THAF10]QFT90340.1 Tyrosine-protein kinase YwqD [Bacillus sp. THAF10]
MFKLIKDKWGKKVSLMENMVSTDQIRIIRTNIEDELQKERIFLTVTSPNLEDQKSVISAKLAISFAELGKKVLLVDANLRRPSLHKFFNASNASGLVDVIEEKGSINLYAKVTFTQGLFLLPSGTAKDSSSNTGLLNKAEELMAEWGNSFEVIILEAPSFLKSSDAHILSRKCDGVILVMKEHSTKKDEAMQTKHYLERSNKKIVGVIYQTA